MDHAATMGDPLQSLVIVDADAGTNSRRACTSGYVASFIALVLVGGLGSDLSGQPSAPAIRSRLARDTARSAASTSAYVDPDSFLVTRRKATRERFTTRHGT